MCRRRFNEPTLARAWKGLSLSHGAQQRPAGELTLRHSINFVYHPTTGDRVFAHRPHPELVVVRWANGCRHVVGGVHVMVDAPGRLREATRLVTTGLVNHDGGIAWDDCGRIHAIVPPHQVRAVVELWCRVVGIGSQALLMQQDAEVLREQLVCGRVVMWQGALWWWHSAEDEAIRQARALDVQQWSELTPAAPQHMEPPAAAQWTLPYCATQLTPTADWTPVEVTGGARPPTIERIEDVG